MHKLKILLVVLGALFLSASVVHATQSSYEFPKIYSYGNVYSGNLDLFRFADFDGSFQQYGYFNANVGQSFVRYLQACPDQNVLFRLDPFAGLGWIQTYWDPRYLNYIPNLLQMNERYHQQGYLSDGYHCGQGSTPCIQETCTNPTECCDGPYPPDTCPTQTCENCIYDLYNTLQCSSEDSAEAICGLLDYIDPTGNNGLRAKFLGLTLYEEMLGHYWSAELACNHRLQEGCYTNGMGLWSCFCGEPWICDPPDCPRPENCDPDHCTGPELYAHFKQQYTDETNKQYDSYYYNWCNPNGRDNIRQWVFNRSMESYKQVGTWIGDVLTACNVNNMKIGPYFMGVIDLRNDIFTSLDFEVGPGKDPNNYIQMQSGLTMDTASVNTPGVIFDNWYDGSREWITYPSGKTMIFGTFLGGAPGWYGQLLWELAGFTNANRTSLLWEAFTVGGYNTFPLSALPAIPLADALFSAEDTYARSYNIHPIIQSRGFLNTLLSTDEDNRQWTMTIDNTDKLVGGVITHTKYYIPAPEGYFHSCKKVMVPFANDPNTPESTIVKILYEPWDIPNWSVDPIVNPHLYGAPAAAGIIVDDYCPIDTPQEIVYYDQCPQYDDPQHPENKYCYCPNFDADQCPLSTNENEQCCGYVYEWNTNANAGISIQASDGGGQIEGLNIAFQKQFENKELFFGQWGGATNCGSQLCNFFDSPYLIKEVDDPRPEVFVKNAELTTDWYNAHSFLCLSTESEPCQWQIILPIFPQSENKPFYEALAVAFHQEADYPVDNFYLKESWVPYWHISYINKNTVSTEPDVFSIYGMNLNLYSLAYCLDFGDPNNECTQGAVKDKDFKINHQTGEFTFPYVWDRFTNTIINARQLSTWDDYNVAMIEDFENEYPWWLDLNEMWIFNPWITQWNADLESYEYVHQPNELHEKDFTIKEYWIDYNDEVIAMSSHPMGNFLLETSFRWSESQETGYAGIAFHLTDENNPPQNYYFIRYNWAGFEGPEWQLGSVTNGSEWIISRIAYTIEPGITYHIKLDAFNSVYRLHVQKENEPETNSDFIMKLEDYQLSLNGFIALFASSNSAVSFTRRTSDEYPFLAVETDQIPNIFVNGGFEGWEGWSLIGNAEWSFPPEVHTGSRAVKLYDEGLLTQTVMLEEQSSYDINFYGFSSSETEPQSVTIQIIKSGNPDPIQPPVIVPLEALQWSKIQFTFKVNERAAYEIQFIGNCVMLEHIILDDFTLYPNVRDARWDTFSANAVNPDDAKQVTDKPINWTLISGASNSLKMDCRFKNISSQKCCGDPDADCSSPTVCGPDVPTNIGYNCYVQDWFLESTIKSGEQWINAVGGDSGWDEYLFETKISKENFATGCETSSSAGIIFKYHDSQNYYRAQLNYTDDQAASLALYQIVDSSEYLRTQITLPAIPNNAFSYNPQIRSLRLKSEYITDPPLFYKKYTITLDGVFWDINGDEINDYQIEYNEPPDIDPFKDRPGRFGIAYKGDCLLFDGIRMMPLQKAQQ
ncbi:MAG: hypothetical protein A2Y62_02690 [Candidatus Fischerbacteria bacterium RBG_13_37_8]|uniref:CBM-cenC domain-containing protein n=1 Tax=Candidatus Fischerbacteria bacterium RBG_13_37_8 TaxID=1817863 RepID=A0A1F5VT04_9BACT|nr:MAG: hypothetical protein A2Y62_02690 [Candidatus Fischerbacteria bacterium RBG_13_37_8]